ncbi:hypothetical protein PHYBOEH_008974 [Phytophthora boehmeriae]|uniref:Uncharacterized protein n=1 Tax=Phytophthora boehmeriae TaxID=109152 RepID=A0A8T1VZ75_9STRA|nr:hypothetical protein PHYBOEH_008974 [Phytophthora boehmeriae]
MEEAVDVAAAAEGDRTEADTIATRTRTKFSLVDVPIDTLEASLPDSVTDQVAVETEEDREYQRFLSSLLPNEQENLSFLDEEDEEYRPEEEEEDHEDDEARRGISKKELTDLLLDSTHMPFPKTPVAGTSLGPDRNEALLSDERGTSAIDAAVPLPLSGDDSSTMKAKKIQASATPAVANLVNGASSTSKPAAFRGRYGTVTQEQMSSNDKRASAAWREGSTV